MNLRKAQLPKKIRSIWMTSSNFLFVLFLFTILIAQADGNGELYSKNNPTVQGLAGAASVVISPDGNYVYAVTKAKTIPTAVLGSLHWWHRNAATGDLTYKGKISPNDENTGKACFDQGSIAVSPDQMIYKRKLTQWLLIGTKFTTVWRLQARSGRTRPSRSRSQGVRVGATTI